MKLVVCLLGKRPEDSLSAARRRRRRQATRWGCAGFCPAENHFWAFEASCGVPETSLLRCEGSAEFCAGCYFALIEHSQIDFVRLASQSASLGVNRIAIWSAEHAAACP